MNKYHYTYPVKLEPELLYKYGERRNGHLLSVTSDEPCFAFEKRRKLNKRTPRSAEEPDWCRPCLLLPRAFVSLESV